MVAQCADGMEAVEAARRLRPDVGMLDNRVPRLDGLEVTRLIAGAAVVDPIRVVVVTTFDLDEYVYSALRNGACGFLLEDAGPGLLVEAVRAAAAGDSPISPSVRVRLLQHLSTATRSAARPPGEPLTARELDVVRLVARGLTNHEVAAELVVALGTVKAHLGNVTA